MSYSPPYHHRRSQGSREYDRDRDRERSYERDYIRDYDRDYDRDRGREYDKSRGRSRDHSRDRSRIAPPPSSSSVPSGPSNGTKRDADLPISPTIVAQIETLKTTFKKRGHFDTLRKDVFNSFSESEGKPALVAALERIAQSQLDSDSSLESRDRAKATLLIEGAAERAPNVYPDVEKEIDHLLRWQRRRIEELVRGILEETEGKKVNEEEEGNIGADSKQNVNSGPPGEGLHEKQQEDRDRDKEGRQTLERQQPNGTPERNGSRWEQSPPRSVPDRGTPVKEER